MPPSFLHVISCWQLTFVFSVHAGTICFQQPDQAAISAQVDMHSMTPPPFEKVHQGQHVQAFMLEFAQF